ncbi:hypothetical protein V6N13_003187 [Hibiscus sabdariffa]
MPNFSWSEPFLLVPSSGSTIVLVPQPSSNAMFILYVTSSDIAEAYVKRIMARNTLLFRELTRQNKEVNEYYTATLTNVVSASRTILAITSAPTDSEEEKKCFHSITTNMDMLVIFALRKYVQMIFIKTTIMSPRILLHLLTRMALGCYLKRDGDVQTRNQNLLQGKISRYNPISVENEDRNTMATRLIHLPRHPWCLNLLRSHQRMPALMLRNPVAVASLQRT